MLVEDSNFVGDTACGNVATQSAASLTKLHCRQQYARNERLLNQRKIKSRNAARTRRGKENLEFYELAKLLPIPGELSSQLDKASIIRLTMSFLKVREFCYCNQLYWKRSSDGPPPNRTVKDTSRANLSQQQAQRSKLFYGQEGSLILQNLDGFMFVLNYKGQLIYVSEAISVFLGLSQVEMTGSSVFDYVYPEDRNELAVYLSRALSPHDNEGDNRNGVQGEDLVGCLTIRMKSTIAKKGISPKSSSFKVVRICTRVQESSVRFSESKQFSQMPKRDILCEPKPVANANRGIIAFGTILPPDDITDGRLCQNSIVTRVNAALQFSYCESHVQKLLGYEVREVIGQSLYHCIHVADAERMKKCHAELLVKGHVETPYFRWLHKTGGFRWVSATIMPMPNQRLYPEQSFIFIHTIISDVFDGGHLLDLYQTPLGGLEGRQEKMQFANGSTDTRIQSPDEHLATVNSKCISYNEGVTEEIPLKDPPQEERTTNSPEVPAIHSSSISVEADEPEVQKRNSKYSDVSQPKTDSDGQVGLEAENKAADSSCESGISLLCMAQEWAHHLKHRSSLRYADFVSEYMDIDSNYWSNPPNKEVSNHNDLPPGAKKLHGLMPARNPPSVVHHHYPIGIAPPLLHTSPLVAKLMAARWHGVHTLTDSRTLVVTTPVTMVSPFCVPNASCTEKSSKVLSSVEAQTPASVAATLEELKKDPLHKLNPPNKVVSPDQSERTSKLPSALECHHPLLSLSTSVSPCQGSVCVIGHNTKVQLSGTITQTKSMPALNLCSQPILKPRAGSAVFQVPSTVIVPATGILANGAESTVITLTPNSSLPFPIATDPVQEQFDQHMAPCIMPQFTFSQAAVRSVPF